MVTVEGDVGRVERRLAAGEICCPVCGNALSGWGWARTRVLRGLAGSVVRVRLRRAVCSRCQVTHVLLPVVALLRRADLAEVIGAALVAKATGVGLASIAVRLDRPSDTVRGWLRRFAERANGLRIIMKIEEVNALFLAMRVQVIGAGGADRSPAAAVRIASAGRNQMGKHPSSPCRIMGVWLNRRSWLGGRTCPPLPARDRGKRSSSTSNTPTVRR